MRALHAIAVGLIAAALAVPAAADDGGQNAQSARRKPTQLESYVMVEPLYASILQGARSRGLLLVEIGLDVPDAKLRDRVNQELPILRDAYVRSLLVFAATAVRPWRQPNVEEIAGRMQAITDHMLGRPGARVLMAQTAIRITR